MSIPFKEPKPPLTYDPHTEIAAIDNHFAKRNVPVSQDGRLVLATWNIANLGAQGRAPRALTLIAHILSRFDLIAVQEVNDNYRVFQQIVQQMGDKYDFVFSDKAGNDERLAFIYRTDKVVLDKLWGEVALTKKQYPKHTVSVHYRKGGKEQTQTFKNFLFVPFDRNPYIGSFQSGSIKFILASAHLYFGNFENSASEEMRKKYARRVLEIFALARWANDIHKSKNAWDHNVLLLGDMNVPNTDKNEATIKALKSFDWRSIDYVSNQQIGVDVTKLSQVGGSNLGNDRTYDQIAFAPSTLNGKIGRFGVFDYDNAIFREKWTEVSSELSHSKAVSLFAHYVKHHISDHRPLWLELRTT